MRVIDGDELLGKSARGTLTKEDVECAVIQLTEYKDLISTTIKKLAADVSDSPELDAQDISNATSSIYAMCKAQGPLLEVVMDGLDKLIAEA